MTDGDWRTVTSVDLESRNAALVPGVPTADVVIHLPAGRDPAHTGKVTLELLLDGVDVARTIFATAGVQLRLRDVRTGYVDPALLSITASAPSDVPADRFVGMYRAAERRPTRPSTCALEAFQAIVPDVEGSDRVIHLVVLQDVFMNFHEPTDERTWVPRTIATSGLSFPGYSYGATLPRHLRGVITITDLTRNDRSWKTIAHELGHKLMNVSHEHREINPAHEIHSEEGLMLYGAGTEIAAGRAGRFHRERLHVSPYLYVEEGGERDYNPDYVGDGFYHDPIYDGLCIDVRS
jgi:hypothetical protein